MDEMEDTKDVLMQFLGQTYGELHKIDTMITGSSQHLQQRSNAFKNVVSDILTNQVPAAHQSANTTQRQPQLRTNGAAVQIMPTADVQPEIDPNQMEFTFDKSGDVASIYNTLVRLEDKIERIDKKLAKLLDTK